MGLVCKNIKLKKYFLTRFTEVSNCYLLRKLIDDNDLPSRWKTIRKKLTLHDKKWSNIPSKMQIDENLTHGETHIKDL